MVATPPGRPELSTFPATRRFRTVAFPAAVGFRQLVVTGPPGCGKSTLVRRIGGWPEEGFLDLGHARWWRARDLAYRPREVHLGLPFSGHERSLSVFEPDWHPGLELDEGRIRIPPRSRPWSLVDWRRRVVFEFLLPPAESIFAGRRSRSGHPVDAGLTLEAVRGQRLVYEAVALTLWRAGLPVYLRLAFGGDPVGFGGTLVDPDADPHRPTGLIAWAWIRLAGHDRAESIEADAERRIFGRQVRLDLSRLPIEVGIGPQTLVVDREARLAPEAEPSDRVVLVEPGRLAGGAFYLGPGERVRIGRGGSDRVVTSRLPRDILPRLEIVHEGSSLLLADLHSPDGTAIGPRRETLRERRATELAALRRLLGGTLGPLDVRAGTALLEGAIAALAEAPYRAHDSRGWPGGLVELPTDRRPVVVGDLHANLDNLVKVLTEGRLLDGLAAGEVVLLLLGDAVHRDQGPGLGEMESSLVAMEILWRLMTAYPGGVVYLRGNHDSFSPEVRKRGVLQGPAWRSYLVECRGEAFAESVDAFYDRLPYVAVGAAFVACHGGPPTERVDRRRLVDLVSHPRLRHQLTWNRLRRASNPAGYGKRAVRALLGSVGRRKGSLVVSHNPQTRGGPIWVDLGGIPGHHLVYSADPERVGLLVEVRGELEPVVHRAEALARLV